MRSGVDRGSYSTVCIILYLADFVLCWIQHACAAVLYCPVPCREVLTAVNTGIYGDLAF